MCHLGSMHQRKYRFITSRHVICVVITSESHAGCIRTYARDFPLESTLNYIIDSLWLHASCILRDNSKLAASRSIETWILLEDGSEKRTNNASWRHRISGFGVPGHSINLQGQQGIYVGSIIPTPLTCRRSRRTQKNSARWRAVYTMC